MKKYKVLLIEDSPEFAGLVETILSFEYPEFLVDVVTSAGEARDAIERNEYDLIISDVVLSSGDISTILETAREYGKKVILLTGMEQKLLEERISGFDDVIIGIIKKPFVTDEFLSQFREIIKDFLPEST